jgi:hypothetical protein
MTQDVFYVYEIYKKTGIRTTIMKFFKYVLAVLILLSGYAQAFTPLSENFDSGGGDWSTAGDTGASTFDIISDGSGKHLRAEVLRDVNDGAGRYVKALGGTLNIKDVNIFLEADVQVVDGFNNFGSIYLGLGKSGDNFKNQMLTRLYWDGTNGADRYSIYGAIYDSNSDTNRPPLSATGVNQVGMAGLPYRVKVRFSNIKVDDVNRLSYDAKVYRINADGSTGSLVGETNAVQTDGLASLEEVNQVGIFITNAAKAQLTINSIIYPRFLTANIDNVYVSDAGFNPSPVLPSWYNFDTGDTDIYETFTTDPNKDSNWTKVAPAASGCSFTWKQRAGDGFMDVVLTRRPDSNDPAKAARFYRSLGTEFNIYNLVAATEFFGIHWFTEFDVYIVDMDSFAEGLIGTGSTQDSGPWNDMDILAGAYYGAQELGNGIRATLVGYGDNYPSDPVTRRAATVVGLLMPGNTYRMKCTAAQRWDSGVTPAGTRTRMIGALYTINPDGTDGNLVAIGAEWNSTAGVSLYADIMGIFSTFQTTTTTRTMNIYVDNMHFSTVGFNLDGEVPTWFNAPLCSELSAPISGDAGGSAGKGKYDCAVNFYDLMYLAQDWLKIGN